MLRQNFLFILLLCFFTILFFPFFILAQTQTQTQTIPPIVSNTATPSTQSAFSVTSHQSTLSSQLISTSSANLNPTSPTQIQSTSTPDQPIQIIDQSIQVTDNQSSLRLTPLELVVIDKDLDTKKIISPQQTEAISIDEDSSRVFTFDQIFPSTGLAYRPVQEGLQTELAFFQLYKYDFISIAFLIEAKDFELSEQNILELQSSDPTGETHGLTFSLIPQEENNTYHLIINFDQDWLKNQNRMPPVITSFLIKTSDNLSETIMEISDEAESNSTSNTSEEKNQPEEKSLKVTEVNSNNNPDKFYIPAEDIKGAEVVEFEKEFDLLNIKYSKTAIIDDEIIKKSPAKKSLTIKEEKETENENITKLKEILNKDTETTGDFLTYVIITNEENSDVHAITRSEKGLQKIIVKKDSLTSLLYESEKLKPELEDWQYKASSTPIFQFKKTVIARSENDVAIPSETNPNQSDWHDYKLKEITDIKVEEKEDFSLITQNFILEDNTKGQNILKLGFDGENYFSKWTFKLDDNQNINRLLWKTELNEKTEISQPELKTINTQRKIFKNGINIDWSDFKNEAELQTLSDQIIFTQIPIIFYPLGIKGALEIDPTVSLSTPGSTVQIDVSDHYRAIMDTGDTDNFIRIHDRAYTDSTVFAQDITESSTTSTTVYSTKESISADSFIGGDKYFVYVTAGFGHSSSSGRVDYEIRYNTSAQYTGIIEPQGNATAGSVYSISWFDVYDQPATPTDIDIRFKANTAGTAYAYHAQILTINLSDLAVTDWEYGSDVGSTQHTTTMTQQANITLSDADGSKDWLVFAMEEVVIDSGSVQFQGEIYDGSTSYMGYSREGESSLELLSYTLLRPFDDVTQNTVFSIRVRDDASGINDHAKSRVFALNLDAFESHKTHYADISIAISDTAWTELGNLDSGGNYTPTTTGDQLVFASAIWEAGSGYSVNDQLQIGGTTAPIGWDWAQSSATGHGNYNVDDEILQNVMTKISIPTSGQSITYDIIEVQASSQ
ncbi:hypothetical protein KKE45_00410, partial [Patescibacteria group bacterium]|nr:hypothetical protein [Patescibacteria group bacterium]